MSPEQFWDEDPDLMGAYLEAYKQRKEDEEERQDYLLWLNGQYQMMAMAQVFQFSKPIKKIYPKKPFSSSNKKKKAMSQQDYEKIRQIQVKNMVERFKKEKQ